MKIKAKKLKTKSKNSHHRSKKVDKTLLFQLILVVVVSMLITCAAGCRTGGHKVKSSGSGIISITRPSGTWINPNSSVEKAKRVKLKAVKSQPKPSITPEVKATHAPPVPVPAAGKPTPFEPTISKATMPELKAVNAKISPPKLVNVLPRSPKGNEGNAGENNGEVEEEKGGVAVDWARLFVFYFITFVMTFLAWVCYDIYKHKKNKNTPKPKKTARKKPTKKKAAKKKTTKSSQS